MTPRRSSVMKPPMTGSLPGISAFVVCMNEEHQIRRCLESLRFCDEIIVVDSLSTDKTVAICKEYTERVFERPWPGFVAQKRFALEQCRHEWVLNIDADEVVSEDLQREIQGIVEKNAPSCNGYELLRVVYYFHKWWRKGGWHPEYRLRLLRRTKTEWGGKDPHEKALVDGPTKRLDGELHHYSFNTIAEHLRTINSHSTAAAKVLFEEKKPFHFSYLVTKPLGRILKFFILRKGWREGMPGCIAAIIEGIYAFLKYAKLFEHYHAQKKHSDSLNSSP